MCAALRLVLVLTVIGLCGCARSKVTICHAGFTRAQLMTGRLAIAAVGSWGAGELEGADEMAYAVRERLIAGEPRLQVVPLEEVRHGFAPGAYARWLREFYDQPRWVEADFQVFNRLTNQVRYLMLVTILGTEVASGESIDGGWVETREWNSTTRRYDTWSEFTPITAARHAGRWTRVSFLIYDLQLRQPVWEIIADSALQSTTRETSRFMVPEVRMGPGAVSLVSGVDAAAMKVVGKLPKPQ